MLNLRRAMPLLVACGAVLAFSGSAGATSLVTNGGFETGDFSAWTQGGNIGNTFVSTKNVHSGIYAAQFGPVGSQGLLTQVIPTVAGQQYQVSFWLANDGGSPNSFSVSFANVSLSFSNEGAFSYKQYSFLDTATNLVTGLGFAFQQDPAYFHLDDVSVQPVGAVPLPAALPLFATGLGILGFVGWRRKRKTAALAAA